MIIVQAPLRVSLLGGGTDLPEWCDSGHTGCVVGGAIDKYIYVILKKRYDKKIVIGYTKQETVYNISEIRHDLIREAAKFCLPKDIDGFELKTMADIPSEGSGLGSSSTLLVCLIKAFYTYINKDVSNKEIAEIAYHIERKVLGRPIGYQDAYFSALGGKKQFTIKNGKVDYIEARFYLPNKFLVYSGVSRSSSPILEDQASKVNEFKSIYEELTLLAEGYDYCIEIENLIRESWELKKKLSPEICTDVVQKMEQLAKNCEAKAYKILGAGGGGYFLVCTEESESYLEYFRNQFSSYDILDFEFVNHGARVIFNNEE